MHFEQGGNCECAYCKNMKAFNLPDELIEAAERGDLVIFAGAGVSTEARTVYKYTLYEDIKSELGIEGNLSFSQLMSKYCESPNGRIKLLHKIKSRFDYVTSFPELARTASSFHRELSTLFQINNIITTNWDDLFEKYCGAIPIVTSEDFVFWDLPERKVLKIHGSINNYGSIVATEEDYNKCYEKLNSGLIGSSLKIMLATKYVVFVGYSFGDEDFNRIHNSLIKEMNGLMPHSYIVTLNESAVERFKDMNLTPIITDATYFISSLKNSLSNNKHFISDDIYEKVAYMLYRVKDEHTKLSNAFNIKEHPEVVFSLYYQDGLIHAFERVLALKKTGHYSHSCNITKAIQAYDEWRKKKLKGRIYHDVAYIDGYMNGLTFLLMNEEDQRHLHLYYLFGYDYIIETLDEYAKLADKANKLHKSAYKYALKIVSEVTNESNEIVFHHTPFL